jgi:hypothetical protein
VIVSASYKTDIPTFYGEWFINRLRAGFCFTVNPYGRQVYRVALDRSAVDGFVFWTKNVGPFLKHLPEVKERGFPFLVQYTINGYPRELETSVVDSTRSVEHAHRLRDSFGPKAVVWRYDTILLSSLTPPAFHLENFTRLADALAGATDEVVVSFAQVYRKTKRNVDAAARDADFTWSDPSDDDKRALMSKLIDVATARGLRLAVCSQKSYVVPGASEARCVDAERLRDISGQPLPANLKGNRPECGCFASRDICDYDTCPHGCVYCYAVQNRELALTRYKRHDPSSPFLFEPPPGTALPPEPKGTLPLFRP